jgi:hypothetical protein
MKTLATIILAVVAIIASPGLVLSTLCAFAGGFSGRERGAYVICAAVALAVVAAAMSAIGRLNKKT